MTAAERCAPPGTLATNCTRCRLFSLRVDLRATQTTKSKAKGTLELAGSERPFHSVGWRGSDATQSNGDSNSSRHPCRRSRTCQTGRSEGGSPDVQLSLDLLRSARFCPEFGAETTPSFGRWCWREPSRKHGTESRRSWAGQGEHAAAKCRLSATETNPGPKPEIRY